MSLLEDDFVFITHDDVNDDHDTLDGISQYIESIADELWRVNKKIHDNPELGFKEFIAHETLTSFMKTRAGWKVSPSVYGMATAWIAVCDSGRKGPVVSFNAEMDALQGIGHACGHNLIATASLAGALALGEMLKRRNLNGKVVLFGTPAEEGGGGKIKLLERGAYRDHKVDISLISHPGTVASHALVRTSAYSQFKVEYFGREAHAAAEPWLGINALDAFVTAYNGVSVLRQQTMPGDVIQCNITNGGLRPNIIHAYTSGNFVVRANTHARLVELSAKVRACLEAAALATGARVQITPKSSYADHVPNRVLAAHYRGYFNQLEPPELIPDDLDVDEIEGRTAASTDQGNISHAMPSLSPGFSVPAGPGGAGPHNPGFAESAGTRVAFERCLRVGKALAGVGVDILENPDLLREVKKEWERETGKDGTSSRS
ncbi:hypothetical protein F5Y16DRAFT_361312 [Xylariaceae sp. FL0255]|nr:hypothetical protein F5Y16DRAFT_361312 [Xylariaceae sp. FL0255]